MIADIGKCFKLLGLPPDAVLGDVKKAYRKLAKEHHPDRFTDDEGRRKKQAEIMAEINGAYRVAMKNIKAEAKPEKENDTRLYKKGLEFYERYMGSNTTGYQNIMSDYSLLMEKKDDLGKAKIAFTHLLKEYPESDWAFDSEERLKKIENFRKNLEERISAFQTQTKPRENSDFYQNKAGKLFQK